MAGLQPVRGTHDLIAEEARRHYHIIEAAREIVQYYGFEDIQTPIFEFTEVFQRTLGETSDVVSKEMYSFEDRGGESLTLRPENTAGVARAFISNGLMQHLPLKLFYQGPMFRYERPQKGRQRQFHQIGAEYIGVADPQADVEVILMGAAVLKALGLSENVTLELNSLGDRASRDAYREVLVQYFSDHREQLSKDSLARLARNPLRILDSKDEGDRVLCAQAPTFQAYMTEESKDFFAQVREGLTACNVSYTLNEKLVRGLDYYCHTAFEFVTTQLGAQGTVLAGGRYDGLIGFMGGPETPAVGWAAGVERLSMLATGPKPLPRPVAMIALGDSAEKLAFPLVQTWRDQGFYIDFAASGNMKKRMKAANKRACQIALILGENELDSGTIIWKDLDTGHQEEIALSQVEVRLSGLFCS